MSIQIVRVEYEDGYGIWRAIDNDGIEFCDKLSTYDDFWMRHRRFPSPWRDPKIGEIHSYQYCAFKTVRQLQKCIKRNIHSHIICFLNVCLSFKLMFLMRTIRTFKGVRGFLSRIPDIDWGGCGIAAYAMYLWLKANNKPTDDFRFVLLYDGATEDRYTNNQNVLHKGKGKGKAPCHMGVFYENTYMDSSVTIDISRHSFVQIVKDEWFITNCINNKPTWNHWFKRKYVSKIEKTLNITMNINK